MSYMPVTISLRALTCSPIKYTVILSPVLRPSIVASLLEINTWSLIRLPEKSGSVPSVRKSAKKSSE